MTDQPTRIAETWSSTYQAAPVWLVDSVLHGLINKVGIWGRSREGRRQNRKALHIENLSRYANVKYTLLARLWDLLRVRTTSFLE